jgi:hypothetical protein
MPRVTEQRDLGPVNGDGNSPVKIPARRLDLEADLEQEAEALVRAVL